MGVEVDLTIQALRAAAFEAGLSWDEGGDLDVLACGGASQVWGRVRPGDTERVGSVRRYWARFCTVTGRILRDGRTTTPAELIAEIRAYLYGAAPGPTRAEAPKDTIADRLAASHREAGDGVAKRIEWFFQDFETEASRALRENPGTEGYGRDYVAASLTDAERAAIIERAKAEGLSYRKVYMGFALSWKSGGTK